MTWNLEADIDVHSNPFALVTAFLEFIAPDIEQIVFKVTHGYWSTEIIKQEGHLWYSDTIQIIQSLYGNGPAIDQTIQIVVILSSYENWDYFPVPELYLFGSQHPGMGDHRRRSNAVISFGNRRAYMGKNILPSGKKLDEFFVIEVLQHICKQVQPESLYLINEECVSIPLNYHFIFHRHLAGYATDLAEIVQLILYGGKGFNDARRRYEPALSNNSTMLFCKRGGDYLASLKQFWATQVEQLEAHGIPEELDSNLVEDALIACEHLEFFYTSHNGLGIYSKPLLESYCEDLYNEFIYRLNN